MAARATGSGTISFGLVSIPIKVYTATQAQSVSFHMLHKTCGHRVRMQLVCPNDKEVVSRKDTVKGFEHAKDQFVQFSEEELKKLEAEKSDRIDIVEFVPESTVDFIFIADTHYLGPGKGGDRAYKLLSDAMTRTKRIAVGRQWTHGKEQLVLLRPYKGGLIMHGVYYADEVRSMDDVERPSDNVQFKPVEEELADKLIDQLSAAEFKPEQYHDEYRDRVMAAVEQKVMGLELSTPEAAPQAQIIDLFEALKKSLEKSGKAANEPSAEEAPKAESTGEAAEGDADAKPVKKASGARKERVKKTG